MRSRGVVLFPFFSILFLCILGHVPAHAEFKKLSSEQWSVVLNGLGISPEQPLVERFVRTGDTIEKIQQQTKDSLRSGSWIEVFKKLDLQPKPDMQPEEWAAFFRAINLEFAQKPSFAAPAPISSTLLAQETFPSVVPSPAVPPQNLPAPPDTEAPLPAKQIKISLDLRGADVFSALKLISQKTGFSIVAASDVKGSVTIYLQDVDALAAFKTILEMNDLAYVREGSVFKVMTAPSFERTYGRRFLDTTKVEVILLSYAKASAVEKMVLPLKSKVGQIITDTGTNALIVIDTPENIQVIKNLVRESFDRRHREVIIEAKIIQIMLNDSFKMGINWESVFSKANTGSYGGTLQANLNALNPTEPGIRLSVGTLAVDNFTVLYDLLQTAGKTNLLSSPRIAAIDSQEARILVGTKEAYVTTTVVTPGTGASTTAESVNFIDVGMKLYVTPVIGEDGFITLRIRPEVSSVERNLITAQGNTIPIIRTSESETTVMVKDGITVVIAGLMEERKEKMLSGVPFLSNIPVIGLPFRRTIDTTHKTELAVLLTPHIMTGDVPNLSREEKIRFKIK